jgi:hypothetical protein
MVDKSHELRDASPELAQAMRVLGEVAEAGATHTIAEYEREYERLFRWRDLWNQLSNSKRFKLASQNERIEEKAARANRLIGKLIADWDSQRAEAKAGQPAAASESDEPAEDVTLETALWAAANFISCAPDHRPPEQREAVLKGLWWAIETFTAASPEPAATPLTYVEAVDAIAVAGANVDLNACLTRILRDLPTKRDWLDPEVEKWARQLTGEQGRSI